MTLVKAEKQRNYNSIDLCKFIMALFVIAIHTRPYLKCPSRIILEIYGSIAGLAVPFFFLASGYLLAVRFNPGHSGANIDVVLKYLRKIVRIYIIWSAVYFPLAVYYYHKYKAGVSFLYAAASYARCFLFTGQHFNSWQLWYLLSTIYALVIVIIMLRCKLSSKKWMVYIGSVFIVRILMDELADYSGTLPEAIRMFRILIEYTTTNGRILEGFYFIPIGMLMANKDISFRKCLILYIGSSLLDVFIDHTVVSRILVSVASVTFFGVIIHVDLKDHPVYFVLRKVSTDMYLIHMYIWTFYYAIMYGERKYSPDSFLVTVGGSFVFGLIHFCHDRKHNVRVR